MKKRYLVCCEIMRREVEFLLDCRDKADTEESVSSAGGLSLPAEISFEVNFLRKGFHENPEELKEEVQKAIGAAPVGSEAVLIGYGLCGKGLEGVRAEGAPLVIPRVHDCISILLGSAQKYAEHFRENPGTYYYSPGWVEWGKDSVERAPAQGFGLGKSYEEYVEKYGEENARYLMELESEWARRYKQAVYIDTGVPGEDWEARARELAGENSLPLARVAGSLRLLKMLLAGPWPEEEFLVVETGERIAATNDAAIMCRC